MLISDFFANEERPFQTNDLLDGSLTLLIKVGEKRKNTSKFRDDGREVPAIIFEDDKRFVLLRTIKQMTEARLAFGNDMTQWAGRMCRLSLAPWTSPEGTEEWYIKVEAADDRHWRQGHFVRKPRPRT